MKKKHYSEKEIKKLELKLQSCEVLTSKEINFLWDYKTKKKVEKEVKRMIKKEFQVIYNFSQVIDNIEAESQEEAERIANERAEEMSYEHTSVCDLEVEEVKD